MSSPETLPEIPEDEKTKMVEQRYQEGGRYIDGSPEHRAALHLLEEQGIKKFTHRQHLFKVLYHLTDPPPQEKKVKSPTPPPTPPLEPPPRKLVSLPIIDSHSDIGGEGGV